MSNKKGDGKEIFSHAVNNEQDKNNNLSEDKTLDVPDMIKKDQPKHILRPRGWDGLVDRELFEEKWNKQVQSYKPKEQIAKSSSKLSDVFDQITDRRNTRDQDRGRK